MAPSGGGWSTHKLALTLVAGLAAVVLFVVLVPGTAKDDVYLRQPRTPREHQAGDGLDQHGSRPNGQPSVTSLPERVPTEVSPPQAECPPCTTPPPPVADAGTSIAGLTPGELEYDFQADVAHSAGTIINVVFVAASSQQHFWMFMVYDLLQAATPYMIRMHYMGVQEAKAEWAVCLPNTVLVILDTFVFKRWDVNKFMTTCGHAPIGFMHLDDKFFDYKFGYKLYADPKVMFVYRHHYPSLKDFKQRKVKATTQKKVFLMPFGSISAGVATRIHHSPTASPPLPSSRRRIFCSFVGTVKHHQDRKDMAKSLETANMAATLEPKLDKRDKAFSHYRALPDSFATSGSDALMKELQSKCLFVSAKGWMSKANMSPFEYFRVLQDSVFHLVPRGKGAYSFRLYEALLSGAVPIIPDSTEFSIPLGKQHPLPTIPVGKWKSTASVIKRLMDNPHDTAALHKRVMEWWREWTVKWRLQLHANIERLVVANAIHSGKTPADSPMPDLPPIVPTDIDVEGVPTP